MIVTCDKCKTKYNVAEELVGKKIRCIRCGNIWRLNSDPFSFGDLNHEETKEDNSLFEKDKEVKTDAFSVSVSDEPKSQSDVDAMFDTPADLDEPKSQSDVDAMFDAPADLDEPKSQSDVDAMFDTSADLDEPKNEEEFSTDNVFNENIENEQEAASIIEQISTDISDEKALNKVDVFNNVKKKQGFSFFKFFIISVFSMIGFSLTSLWFLRFELAKEVPVIIHYYEKLGIDVNPVGFGLEFKDVLKEKTTQDGVEYLWFKGNIVNVSEKSRKLPSAMLILYDANHIIVDSIVFGLDNKVLDVGKSESFTFWVENPPLNAIEAELTFTRDKK